MNTNYPIDLYVEHSNKVFKENVALYRGMCTQKILDRLSKSQTVTKAVLDNFRKEFDQEVYVRKRKLNEEAFEGDVRILIDFLKPYELYKCKQRKFISSLAKFSADPLVTLDMYHIHDWIKKRLNDMKMQSALRR